MDDECHIMLDHLQQYVPHLERLIVQLKNPKKENRELQLSKLEGLHSMITDKQKKLKIDTLRKCEDVILKILQKVHPTIIKTLKPYHAPNINSNPVKLICKTPPQETELKRDQTITEILKFQAAREKLNELSTPASPSPPRDIPLLHKPIVIPTEKIKRAVIDYSDVMSCFNYKTEKPDVYSKAAKTLLPTPFTPPKGLVFDRLGSKVDMTKPPLSAKDLEDLVETDKSGDIYKATENLSIDQLVDLRERLHKKIQQADQNKLKYMKDLRDKLNDKKLKNKDNATLQKTNSENINTLSKSSNKNKNTTKANVSSTKEDANRASSSESVKIKTKSEKIFKNPESKFGNLLSSIDDQILEDKKKEKKETSSKDHKKDKHDIKKVKKSENSSKKNIEQGHSSKDPDKKSKDTKKGHKHKKNKEKSKEKTKDAVAEKLMNTDVSDTGQSQSPNLDKEVTIITENKQQSLESQPSTECKNDNIFEANKESLQSETVIAENQEPRVFKRLADKYNPHPRKNSVDKDNSRFISDTNILNPDVFIQSPNIIQNRQVDAFGNFHMQQENSKAVFQQNRPILPNNSITNHTIITGPSKPILHNFTSNFRPNEFMGQPNFISNQQTQQIINQNITIAPNAPNFMNAANFSRNIATITNQLGGIFQNQPKKVFHPYEPIASENSKYDLSQMPPTDFYTPTFEPPTNTIGSPPHYANRQFISRDPRSVWIQDTKNPRIDRRDNFGNLREQPFVSSEKSNNDNIRMREEIYKSSVASRDPRIRMRELKEKEKLNQAFSNKVSVNQFSQPNSLQIAPKDKFDSAYSNLDKQLPSDKFTSPLDSLYTSPDSITKKQGKGYGYQKFRIPKKKSENEDKKPLDEVEVSYTQDEPMDNVANTKSESDNKDTNVESFTGSKTKESNKQIKNMPEKEKTPPKEETKKEEPTTSDNNDDSQNLISEFLAKIIRVTDRKTLLDALFASCSDKDKKKIKKLRVIESDSEEEEEEKHEPIKLSLKKYSSDSEEEEAPKIENKKLKCKVSKNKSKGKSKVVEDEKSNNSDDQKSEDEEISESTCVKSKTSKSKKLKVTKKIERKEEEKIINSVEDEISKSTIPDSKSTVLEEDDKEILVDKIKSTNRQTCKHKRTELDMLHDDIKEMFIRDGVLTASGKRMCRIIKDNPDLSEVKKDERSIREESPDSPKRRARESNPKVVIEKTDLSKLLLSTKESIEEKAARSKKNKDKPVNSEFQEILPKRNTNRPNYNEEAMFNKLEAASTSPVAKTTSTGTHAGVGDVSTNSIATASKKIIKKRKRGNSWASGVIKKERKKKNATNTLVTTEDDQHSVVSSVDDSVEVTNVQEEIKENQISPPDKNYYFDPNLKPECKLCTFKGKMIIHHYRNTHPLSEVLISRLAPEIAESAIQDSKEKKFDLVLPTDNSVEKRQKYTFKCRFCQNVFENETYEFFFDHIASHTGEYRFSCNVCSFMTSNFKYLRSHYHSAHHIKVSQIGTTVPVYSVPSEYHIVFGYICLECNFVQLLEENIKNHRQLYHPESNDIIVKIDMSMIIVDKNEKVNEEIVEKVSEQNKPSPETEDKTSEIIEDKSTELISTPSTSVAKVDEKLHFKGDDTKVIEEEEAFDVKITKLQDKLLCRKKINFNLLDKLKSKLEVEHSLINIDINNDSKEEDIKEDDTSAKTVELPITSEKELILEDTNTAFIPTPNETPNVSITAKSSIPISNTIERLQGKLIPIKFSDNELASEDILAEVGPLKVGKRNDEILYVCYVKSCIFSTSNSSDLEKHCLTLHSDKEWDGYCKNCNVHTGFSKVTDAFYHLISLHKPDIEKKQILRVRNMRDLFQVNDGDEKNIDEENINNSQFSDSIVKEEDHSFPFQICNVVSLKEEEDESKKEIKNVEPPPPVSTNISATITNYFMTSKASSPGVLSTSSIKTVPLQLPTTTSAGSISLVLPFLSPIKQSSSPTLTGSNVISRQLSPINIRHPLSLLKTSQSPSPSGPKKIILKDTPLLDEEMKKPRKSGAAFKSLMTIPKLMHLYKCPEMNCAYSTNLKKQFDAHLREHPEFSCNVETPCLYCNYKIMFSLIAIHYDIRHSKSLYCCRYCFYRANNQSYVEIHQEEMHPSKPRMVYLIPLNKDALLSNAKITPAPLRNVMLPYNCGQPGCYQKFLFTDDFEIHLTTSHSKSQLHCYTCQYSPINIADAITHAETHDVYKYQCRYCMFGSSDLDGLYKHLAKLHFALSPQIITRKRIQNIKGRKSQTTQPDYFDSDETFKDVVVTTTPYFKYVTKNAIVQFTNEEGCDTKTQNSKSQPNQEPDLITTYKTPTNTVNQPSKLISSTPISNTKEDTDKPASSLIDNDVVQVSDDDDKDESAPALSSDLVKENLQKPEPIILNKYLQYDLFKSSSPSISINSTDDCKNDDINVNSQDTNKNSSMDNNLNQPSTSLSNENLFTEIGQDSEKISGAVMEFSDLSVFETSLTKEITKKTGLTGKHLFCCKFCKASFYSSNQFKIHFNKCATTNLPNCLKPFVCIHCYKGFKSCNRFMDHLRLHGIERFFCSLCDFKHQHQVHLRSHMKTVHKVNNVFVCPMKSNKTNFDEDYFYFKPKFIVKNTKPKAVESPVANKDGGMSNTPEQQKISFSPDEIGDLPIRPIFSTALRCSVCGYDTKVKANLVRHLQFHEKNIEMPAIAPVNPVPCLDKKEKMFDRMTNLAHSSFSEASTRPSATIDHMKQSILSKEEEALLPLYIPSAKRYVCGAKNCNYLNPEESMLINHVVTFHSEDIYFKCSHCQKQLCLENEVIKAVDIVQHLKLHGSKLYMCKYCKFTNNVKHTVERHLIENHPMEQAFVVVVREIEEESNEFEEIKESSRPWRCGMCKYRCGLKNDVVSHVLNKHQVDYQYKCAHCNYGNNDKNLFSSHFNKEHSESEIDIIDVYHKVEETSSSKNNSETSFDTTPLWQRDKFKIKYIRGIPIIEEKNKIVKKTLTKASSDNLSKSIEAVVNGSTSSPTHKTKKAKIFKEKSAEASSTDVEINNDDSIIILDEDDFNIESDVSKANEDSKEAKDDSDDFNFLIPTDFNHLSSDLDKVTVKLANGKMSTKSLSLKDIQDIDINDLKTTDYIGHNGAFGKPLNRLYTCPICNVFRIKKSDDFIAHLQKELNYYRFVCTHCGETAVVREILQKHSAKVHKFVPEAIHPLSPEPRHDDWIEKVFAIQHRLIHQSGSPTKKFRSILPKETSTVDEPKDKSLENKLFKCQHCDFQDASVSKLLLHSKNTHHSKDPIPTLITPQSESNKRKLDLDSSDVFEPPSKESNRKQIDDTTLKHDYILVCHYCPKRCINESEVKDHWEKTHQYKGFQFKYKQIRKSDVKKPNLMYKCGYCNEVGMYDFLKKHFQKFHPKVKMIMYRYKCKYEGCNHFLRNLDDVKVHTRQCHNSNKSNCVNVEQLKLEDFNFEIQSENCNYCQNTFARHEDLIQHHNKLHSHLEMNFSDAGSVQNLNTFKCKVCNYTSTKVASLKEHVRTHNKAIQCLYCMSTFVYSTLARDHHNKEHADLEFNTQRIVSVDEIKNFLNKNMLILKNGVFEPLNADLTGRKREPPSNESNQPNKVQIIDISEDEVTVSDDIATTTVKLKTTARKSTTPRPQSKKQAPCNNEGFSYYGNKPDMKNIENVKAMIPILESATVIPVSISQLSSVNFFPKVVVADACKSSNCDIKEL